MCRRRSLVLAAVVTGLTVVASAGADELATYLERHDLIELLAVHLEMQLEEASLDQREPIVLRLAEIYARLLESVDDDAARVDLETRSRRLIREAPPDRTEELRLALLRVALRGAERIAEQHRLRLVDETELARAQEILSSRLPELTRLQEQIETTNEQLDRRVKRASGGRALLLMEEADRGRRLLSEANFLAAWSFYYQAWLTGRNEYARTARRLFAELLDGEDQALTPESVSVDLRGSEAIARCILGYALSRSLTGSARNALAWLALLEHERTYEPLQEEVPAWRLAILLEQEEYLSARAELETLMAEAGDEAVPVHWLRLVAVHALEADPGVRGADPLARMAVTELAARGELKQVYDLAERYGVASLGAKGFALRYVGGVLAYFRARETHDGDDPTTEPGVAAQYGEAMTELTAALAEPDLDIYPGAVPDARRLIAWCLYFRGELLAAHDAFVEAAGVLPAADAPEALWMAIVCLDRMVEASTRDGAYEDQLAALITRFLDEYPASEHAPKLLLRRALRAEEMSYDIVRDLQSVPANSDVYPAARRQAARVLYRLFRDADDDDTRIDLGSEYLSVAVPIFEELGGDGRPGDTTLDFARWTVVGRRILEVSLAPGIGRLVAARTVLDRFDEVAETTPELFAELGGEIAYRHVQERLRSGDVPSAMSRADALHDADPDAVWTRLANQALLREGRRRWQATREGSGDDRIALALVTIYGARFLGPAGEEGATPSTSAALTVHAIVADAMFTRWERSREEAVGREALDRYERLLEARPRNARFLRSAAMLAEAFARPDDALTRWRTLLAGLPADDEAWFEAKFHLVSLLAVHDPPRARAVLDQHRQLNPDYGPDPWGARLAALDRRVLPASETPIEEPPD